MQILAITWNLQFQNTLYNQTILIIGIEDFSINYLDVQCTYMYMSPFATTLLISVSILHSKCTFPGSQGESQVFTPIYHGMSMVCHLKAIITCSIVFVDLKWISINLSKSAAFSLQTTTLPKTTSNLLRIKLKGKLRFNKIWPLEGAMYITLW